MMRSEQEIQKMEDIKAFNIAVTKGAYYYIQKNNEEKREEMERIKAFNEAVRRGGEMYSMNTPMSTSDLYAEYAKLDVVQNDHSGVVDPAPKKNPRLYQKVKSFFKKFF